MSIARVTGDKAAGSSREEFIDKTASDILAKLPAEVDLDRIRKGFGIDVSPTSIVLLQELERFNKLINRMKLSLLMLAKVSEGQRSGAMKLAEPSSFTVIRRSPDYIGHATVLYYNDRSAW